MCAGRPVYVQYVDQYAARGSGWRGGVDHGELANMYQLTDSDTHHHRHTAVVWTRGLRLRTTSRGQRCSHVTCL